MSTQPSSTLQTAPTTRKRVALVAGLVLATALAAQALPLKRLPVLPDDPEPLPPPTRPRIEVAFVLDTTGSMSGLIEGAKRKIWSIANQLANGQPRPEIRVGLVAYRDRGDAYVTRIAELTSDLDAIYATLQAHQAHGGGDTPESVNQALHEAVTRLDWSAQQDVYKVVFLVGDAPPHMDYSQEVQYPETLRLARERGIVVNTVQCGSMAATATVWQAIASSGDGRFARVEQSGGMVARTTPMDAELSLLNRALADTVVAYGDADARREMEAKRERAREAPAEVAASRLSYLSKAGDVAISGAMDLLDAVKKGAASVSEVAEDALPAPLRAMAPAAREAYVAEQLEVREELQSRIAELAGRRDAWLADERKRRSEAGEADAFDDEVLDAIRDQAAEAGIYYD